MNPKILITKSSQDYALLDSGRGEKLERFGAYVLSRPDPQALWAKSQPDLWGKVDAVFAPEERNGEKSSWKIRPEVPERWQISFGGLKVWIKPSSFKHVGIFPEQSENWKWVREVIENSSEKVSVLNLFGYTGGASLAAAQAGAEVCHLDGSKTAIAWGKENAVVSGLSQKPIRWILDDAIAFVKREIKRGKKYNGIIMDPPVFGRGPEGEIWKIEQSLLQLTELCRELTGPRPLFFLINGYAAGYSSIAYENILKDLTKNWGGAIESGELALQEEKTGRLLPAGIFARWKA